MQIETTKLLPKETRIQSEEVQQFLRSVPTEELARKFEVAESTARNYKAGLHRISLSQLEKLEFSGNYSVGLEASNKFLKLSKFIEPNKDLLWFIGFWRGDNDNSETRIGVCNIEESIIKKSLEVLSSLVGSEHVSLEAELPLNFSGKVICEKTRIKKQRKQVCYTARVYRKLFRIFFLNLVSEIENNIQKLSGDLQIAYVSGLVDAEGNVHKKKGIVRIWQKDSAQGKELLSRIKKLLEQNKISSSNLIKDHDDLVLNILKGKNNKNMKKFLDLAYLQSARKQEKVNVLLFPH